MDGAALIRAYFEAQNESDWGRLRRVLAPEVEFVVVPANFSIRGRARVISGSAAQRTQLPDVRTEVVDVFATEERGVAETMTTYTLTAPWNTGIPGLDAIPGTGQRIERPGVFLFSFDQGAISRIVHYHDRLGVLQQAGALPGSST